MSSPADFNPIKFRKQVLTVLFLTATVSGDLLKKLKNPKENKYLSSIIYSVPPTGEGEEENFHL